MAAQRHDGSAQRAAEYDCRVSLLVENIQCGLRLHARGNLDRTFPAAGSSIRDGREARNERPKESFEVLLRDGVL